MTSAQLQDLVGLEWIDYQDEIDELDGTESELGIVNPGAVPEPSKPVKGLTGNWLEMRG